MIKKIMFLCLFLYISFITIVGYFYYSNKNETIIKMNDDSIVRYSLAPDYRLINVNWRTPDDIWILSVEDTTIKPRVYRFTQKDPTVELQKIIYIEER